MLDMFLFETSELVGQLEQVVLKSEKSMSLSDEDINEIFRIMHTIKGSSAMMLFNNISGLAHSIEDLFYYIREEKPADIDNSKLTDIVLDGLDFIKVEIIKIQNDDESDGDPSGINETIKDFLSCMKEENPGKAGGQKEDKSHEPEKYYIQQAKQPGARLKNVYKAELLFEEGCEMENIRAFTVVHSLKSMAGEIYHIPSDIIDNDRSSEIIKKQGFKILFRSNLPYQEIYNALERTVFLKQLELEEISDQSEIDQFLKVQHDTADTGEALSSEKPSGAVQDRDIQSVSSHQSIISVNVEKLDKLMDLVGELVISEAMVTQNPDLRGLVLDNFSKSARQLKKITGELQDIVMSIRMVPLSTTFLKMNRVVRDMSRKLGKKVDLKIIGEETEVDKSIIDHISDPLMHLIRNSIDHGIETEEERTAAGKPQAGTVTLEARNAGGDVLIIVKDDGKGLDRDKILRKGAESGLLTKPAEEMTDKEIYSLIFHPGFSTKEKVTEFSGRGVGMDVVTRNLSEVGGAVSIDSLWGRGTAITLKIPLTLAIIDGMTIRVGASRYTVPITSIRESFKTKEGDVIKDPDGNEMMLIRGRSYPVLRLHKLYNVATKIVDIHDGIVIMVENEGKSICIFADELVGEQQVVVKALPRYLKRVNGLAGCTLLGDGGISLILDTGGLIQLL
jgi:two-component system chemotaxis sensor kinase CheA